MTTQAEILNNNVDEMAQHGYLYRKTQKSYRLITILYVALFGLYAFIGVIYGITLVGENAVMALIEVLIFKAGTILCGVMACRKRNMVYGISSAALQLLSTLFKFNEYNIILLAAVVVFVVKISINNRNYKYLSEQFGFPHFNERRTNQDFDTKQRGIKDEFQQNYDRMKKTATDEMGDLSKATPNDSMSGQYKKAESGMDTI